MLYYNKINKIKGTQNKSIKFIFRLNIFTPTKDLYKLVKLDNLDQLMKI